MNYICSSSIGYVLLNFSSQVDTPHKGESAVYEAQGKFRRTRKKNLPDAEYGRRPYHFVVGFLAFSHRLASFNELLVQSFWRVFLLSAFGGHFATHPASLRREQG